MATIYNNFEQSNSQEIILTFWLPVTLTLGQSQSINM